MGVVGDHRRRQTGLALGSGRSSADTENLDMNPIPHRSRRGGSRPASRFVVALVGLVWITGSGCSAFNPAFLDVLDTSGEGRFSTLPAAPGHVVISFSNNATIDERLVNFLLSEDLPAGRPGVTLSDLDRRSLRPRVRFRVLVTFLDGTDQVIEFVNGSRVVDPRFAAQSEPDLNQIDFNNAVVLCDVARVEFLPQTPIEVFIPAQIQQWRFLPATDTREDSFRLEGLIPPFFRALTVDTEALPGNIGARDVPAAFDNPLCGAVVTIVLEGVLQVPFLNIAEAGGNPSFDITDVNTAGRIGGRYDFTVSVR
jgi:hypothetical protein